MSNSIAREELEWRANHGGRDQRARTQEQLLSLSDGNSAPVPASCPAGANPDRNVTATSSNVFDSDVAMDMTSETHSAVASPCQRTPSAAPSRSSREPHTHSGTEKFDVSAVPDCFTKYLKKEVPPGSPVLPRAPTEKLKQKKIFDNDRFPVLPGAPTDEEDVISVGVVFDSKDTAAEQSSAVT